jgi:hypothetical protein
MELDLDTNEVQVTNPCLSINVLHNSSTRKTFHLSGAGFVGSSVDTSREPVTPACLSYKPQKYSLHKTYTAENVMHVNEWSG